MNGPQLLVLWPRQLLTGRMVGPDEVEVETSTVQRSMMTCSDDAELVLDFQTGFSCLYDWQNKQSRKQSEF